MISHIHHINFLVKNLEQGIARYEGVLGKGAFQIDQLKGRNVKTARAKVGDTWLVLIQPQGDEGIPAQHLKEHGEGFFLMSLGTDDLDTTLENIKSNSDIIFPTPERAGIDNWRVIDFQMEQFFGAQLQLTQENNL